MDDLTKILKDNSDWLDSLEPLSYENSGLKDHLNDLFRQIGERMDESERTTAIQTRRAMIVAILSLIMASISTVASVISLIRP